MSIRRNCLVYACCVVGLLTTNVNFADPSESDSLSSIGVLAFGALDGRTVVRTSDNRMHVLKIGALIPGTRATVTQILADKLILEDASAEGGAQTVWLTKAGPDGSVKIQRFQTVAPTPEIREIEGSKLIDTKTMKEHDSKKNDR